MKDLAIIVAMIFIACTLVVALMFVPMILKYIPIGPWWFLIVPVLIIVSFFLVTLFFKLKK
jgi:hypothetical protein